ncbi:DUF3696 domain-containing protein [Myroides marinus]|uniref:AAA family ATPase n=1 Tax=Myroides marinus TaxID=703342 RepID=UPI002574A1C8|nr:DUF3696 domain-containing protein [Myroides marinus]MDM1391318.1 DUF3696 domain-containing protein [Myroides marinus]
MSYIKKILFENFKIFEKQEEFEIKPLTFLIGPNSSGKSSIFKAFLLLKSNVQNDLQLLDFSNTKHNLGSFKNTINKYSESQNMRFMFEASVNNSTPFSYHRLSVASKRSISNLLVEQLNKQETDIKLSITYSKNEESGEVKEIEVKNSNDESFLKLILGDEYRNNKLIFRHDLVSKNPVLNYVFIESVIRNAYNFKSLNKDDNERYTYKMDILSENNNPISVFSELYSKFINRYISFTTKRDDISKYMCGQPLRRILKDFSSLIDNTEYIEAVRANTKRLYTNDSQGTSFNELILEFRSRKISTTGVMFINKWLNKFEIADSIEISDVEGVANTVYLNKDGEKIALADLGYGITQFLPILLKLALEQPIDNSEDKKYNYIKKIILLEEPETNLHPKLQSLLGDFLVDAINTFEIKFIIETHSEYIIRKLQVLTATKNIKTDDSLIYYFNSPYKGIENQIIKINIDNLGNLDNQFGQGFFDEATELKFQLLKHKTKN